MRFLACCVVVIALFATGSTAYLAGRQSAESIQRTQLACAPGNLEVWYQPDKEYGQCVFFWPDIYGLGACFELNRQACQDFFEDLSK